MATLRQSQANQRNAALSTGPKTSEGKERSRRNALKHGLAGEGIVLPDEEARAAETRAAEWNSSSGRSTPMRSGSSTRWRGSRSASTAATSTRTPSANATPAAPSSAGTTTAGSPSRNWGRGCPISPALVSRRLRATAPGCAWLIERWKGLRAALTKGSAWTEAQRALALDLLGVAPERHDGPLPFDPEPGQDAAEAERATASDEIERLSRLADGPLAVLEDLERQAAEVGLGEASPELRRGRRYAAGCMRRLRVGPRHSRIGDRPRAPAIGPARDTTPSHPQPPRSPRRCRLPRPRR